MTTLLTLALVFVLGSYAPSAFAHGTLTASDPKAGSVLESAPSSVSLTFTEAVPGDSFRVAITVASQDPVQVPLTELSVTDLTATADLSGLALPEPEAGTAVAWRIGWRYVSADGHPVSGIVDFSVGTGSETIALSSAATEGADPHVAEAATTGEDDFGTTALGVLVGAGVVMIGAVAVVLLRLRRNRRER